jgi:hypothetical protein
LAGTAKHRLLTAWLWARAIQSETQQGGIGGRGWLECRDDCPPLHLSGLAHGERPLEWAFGGDEDEEILVMQLKHAIHNHVEHGVGVLDVDDRHELDDGGVILATAQT